MCQSNQATTTAAHNADECFELCCQHPDCCGVEQEQKTDHNPDECFDLCCGECLAMVQADMSDDLNETGEIMCEMGTCPACGDEAACWDGTWVCECGGPREVEARRHLRSWS